jgi:DNA-directed RNA polymerase subunit RPC12/RpoP
MTENQNQCPLCGGKVYPKPDEPHKGLPRCGHCGAVEIDEGMFVYECEKCGSRGIRLYGLMIPHLCKECLDALVERQRAQGYVCNRCGQPFILCPH